VYETKFNERLMINPIFEKVDYDTEQNHYMRQKSAKKPKQLNA